VPKSSSASVATEPLRMSCAQSNRSCALILGNASIPTSFSLSASTSRPSGAQTSSSSSVSFHFSLFIRKLHLSPSTREPDYEDNEEQAVLREQRARAAAVDFSWIVGESAKPNHVRLCVYLFARLCRHYLTRILVTTLETFPCKSVITTSSTDDDDRPARPANAKYASPGSCLTALSSPVRPRRVRPPDRKYNI
jgi:hypothetical protein